MPQIGQPDTIEIGAALPAGTNILGEVGIDQTTPGTTNAVNIETTGGGTALDSTNKVPVSLYGKYTALGNDPVKTEGQGALRVANYLAGTGNACTGTHVGADEVSNSRYAYFGYSLLHLFNGVGWDRQRGNVESTLLASAARTATVASSNGVNYNGRGVDVIIDVTAITATPSVVFTIQGKDPVSGGYYDILASAAITVVGRKVLRVYPGLTAAANLVANAVLPRTWRVNAVHGDADSITYSVAGVTLL